MTEPFTVVEPRLGLGAETRRILAALPDWFGIPEVNDDYVAAAECTPTWSAVAPDGAVVGVLVPTHHSPLSAEIHLIAVQPEWRGAGVGRALVAAYEAACRSAGVRVLQVKTLGPSHPDPGYATTRAFYVAVGFIALEETSLWGADNPCLIMVKPLDIMAKPLGIMVKPLDLPT